jgi:hypothetical protein
VRYANTGAGAAMTRVEAIRQILPRCWFNEKLQARIKEIRQSQTA